MAGQVGAALALTPTVTDDNLTDASKTAFNSNAMRGFILPAGATLAYSVGSGSLPPGVVLDPVTGVVSGTPTAAGNYSARIHAVASKAGASVPNGADARLDISIP